MNQVTYSPKPLTQLSTTPILAMPAPKRLLPTSPAMTVLTDFSQLMPQSVDADTPIDDAHLKMRHGGIRLLFVMDKRAHCIGVITSKEVIGSRRINLAMQQRNLNREEVTAEMIMTPWQKLSAMPVSQLGSLTIEDLVLSMESFTDQHLLITELNDNQELRIRGLISASDIQNAVGKDINPVPMAKSFSEICQVITGHDL
ncbi:CBS domain-containing protein [Halomonas sp. FME1]|uniref:CBS domain-containing protein n=1 Tax=Halomonas casei TaxID=2742613 RepID=A0ABR9F1I7_9GAMM|nr:MULTISPECIES: CBS domain-containing protein [Halomonas]MBE0400336.1 CBS domain-containing protein [Halomonas casei]PCC20978.1 cystathionine beta-synthase, core [Halomonas sp. JB37]